MADEILVATGIAPLIVWIASFIGYRYVYSEEKVYLLGETRYSRMDRLWHGLSYLICTSLAAISLVSIYIFGTTEEKVNELNRKLFVLLLIAIVAYLILNSQLDKYREYKRDKICNRVATFLSAMFGLFIVLLPPVLVYFNKDVFLDLVDQLSRDLAFFLILYFTPSFLIGLWFAEMDAILLNRPWHVKLILDKEKIRNMKELKENGVNVTGNSIDGILAKETDDQYILYLEESKRNIFLNKAYFFE